MLGSCGAIHDDKTHKARSRNQLLNVLSKQSLHDPALVQNLRFPVASIINSSAFLKEGRK